MKLKKALSIKKTLARKKIYIELKKSENEICGDYIILYPPGVPLIIPGEIISQDIICLIFDLLKRNLNILGLKKNLFVSVVKFNCQRKYF